jgi:hypothetical protein
MKGQVLFSYGKEPNRKGDLTFFPNSKRDWIRTFSLEDPVRLTVKKNTFMRFLKTQHPK